MRFTIIINYNAEQNLLCHSFDLKYRIKWANINFITLNNKCSPTSDQCHDVRGIKGF